MKRWSRVRKVFTAILIPFVILGAGGAAYWNSQTYRARDLALQALQSDDRVVVTQGDGLITFEPVQTQASIGFVFYPGAGVDYRAYAPVLRLIAARGYFVALVPFPLNLAFFNTNAAADVMDRFPDIDVWVVGGHSLGGVAAGTFAANHPDVVDGLIYFASYPANDDLRMTMVKVVSIYGTNDGLATPEMIDESKMLLPADAVFVPVEGGNHSQFGSYGLQSGDNAAAIPADEQWAQIADAAVQFFEMLIR